MSTGDGGRSAVRFRPGAVRPRSTPHGSDPQISTLRELVAALSRGTLTVDLLSVDVFETILGRSCGNPTDLFLWLGRRLQLAGSIPCSAEVFARARSRAEQDVWQREGGMDSFVDLKVIHRQVIDILGLERGLVEDLVAAELALEGEVSHSLGTAREALEEIARSGTPLVFTSDTYLSGAEVHSLLDGAGFDPDARLFVSSDRGKAKASGRLFAEMLTATNTSAPDVLHVGDNPHSDVDVPRAIGMRAAWLADGRLNRYERLMSGESFATAGMSSAMAGASRQARLQVRGEDQHAAALRDVAAGVAAPVLVGYVLWTLERAQRLSLRRLYYLARDGQVLAAIAERLVARLDLPIEIRYLHVSRQSTNLAATFDLERQETDWVFRDVPFLTGPEFLDRFGLSWADVEPHLDRSGAPFAPRDASTISGDVRRLLEADGPLHALVLDRARDRRRAVTGYLEQEGLLDDVATGIVDFGGVGSQVRAIHRLTRAAGAGPPRIMMMGLDDPRQAGLELPAAEPPWLSDTDTWLYDHRRGGGIRRSRGFGTCVQMFCAADHGTVLGYEVADGRVVPVLSEEGTNEVTTWGLGKVREAIMVFVEALVVAPDLVDRHADLRHVSTSLVETLWTTPTRCEAAAWSAHPFEGAQATKSDPQRLGWPYTVPAIVRGAWGGDFPNLGWQHWYEGSVALSSKPVQFGLRRAEAAYAALRRSDGRLVSGLAAWIRNRRH